jgi:hypothetical protein
MRETALPFLTVTILTALLAALSIALQTKGYPHGASGLARLDAVASAATFVPLAALYAFAAVLIVLAPARAADFMYANAASPIFFASIVLLAAIVGLQVARAAFGGSAALRVFLDWPFAFAAAIFIAHQFLDAFRRNVLTRTLGFVLFLAAALACLYWNFRI